MNNPNTIHPSTLNSLKKGDRTAFRCIFNIYEKRLYGFVFSITKSNYATEELLQEIFIKVWEQKEKIDLSLSFNAFIYTIAKNLTYNHLRKIANRETLKQKLWGNISYVNEIENNMIFSEYEDILEDILGNLPQQKRSIFILSRREGMSNQEIADLLGISSKTVKNHLWKTLQMIKRQLQPHLGFIAGFLYILFF